MLLNNEYSLLGRKPYTAGIGIPGGGRVPNTRHILNFNGSQDGEFATAYSLVASDTVEIHFATSTSGTSQFITNFIEFDASDLIQLTNCSVTIDGAQVVDGVDITGYQDGKLHTLVATMSGAQSFTHIGQNGSDGAYFNGYISYLDVNGTVYSLDKNNIYYQLADGTALGSEELTNGDDLTQSPWSSLRCSTELIDGVTKITLDGSNDPHVYQTIETGSALADRAFFLTCFAYTDIGEPTEMTLFGYDHPSITEISTTAFALTTGIQQFQQLINFETATDTRLTVRTDGASTPSPGDYYYVASMSLKELPSTALILNGFTASHIEKYRRTYNPDAWTALDGSPVLEIVTLYSAVNLSHANAADIVHAHVFTSDAHRDGRDYVSSNNDRMLKIIELTGVSGGEDHVTATSGDVLSHQGVTKDATYWYTSDTAALYKWSAIGATPTQVDSNTSPFTALETDTGLSGFNHFGDLDVVTISSTDYLLTFPVNDPSGNPGVICLYDTDLDYVTGSASDFSSSGYRISGVCGSEADEEVYFIEFSASEVTDIYVCDLNDCLAGNMTVDRTITLNDTIYNAQGIYKKGNLFYVEHNTSDHSYVTVYDLTGNPQYRYKALVTGPEGIDFSGSDLLWLKSSGTGQGNIMTIDVDGATEDQTYYSYGIDVDNPTRVDPSTAYAKVNAEQPDQGTLIYKLTPKDYYQTAQIFDNPDSSSSWKLEFVTAGGNTRQRARFYIKSSAQMVQTSDGSTDDLPVDEAHTLAVTWDNTGSGVDLEIYLDGVQKDSATELQANWSTPPKLLSLGRQNKYSVSSNMIVEYVFMYDAVLDATQISNISSDPYAMFTKGRP